VDSRLSFLSRLKVLDTLDLQTCEASTVGKAACHSHFQADVLLKPLQWALVPKGQKQIDHLRFLFEKAKGHALVSAEQRTFHMLLPGAGMTQMTTDTDDLAFHGDFACHWIQERLMGDIGLIDVTGITVVAVVVLASNLRAEAQHTDQYADCKESCHWSSSFR